MRGRAPAPRARRRARGNPQPGRTTVIDRSDANLQRLLDEAEIGRLLLGFGAALDAKDWAAYAATFTEDGVFEIMGQERRGREEIAAGPARDLARYDALQHFSANHMIDVDGDTATATHYVIGIHVPDAGRPERHADVGGRYRCECVRTGEGWRLSRVRIEVLWSAGEQFRIEPAQEVG